MGGRGLRYGEDSVEHGRIGSSHGKKDVPEGVGGFVDGGGHTANMSVLCVSAEPRNGIGYAKKWRRYLRSRGVVEVAMMGSSGIQLACRDDCRPTTSQLWTTVSCSYDIEAISAPIVHEETQQQRSAGDRRLRQEKRRLISVCHGH